MTSKENVPDAWDDDWVNSADTSSTTSADPTPAAAAAATKKLTKSERRARQAEFNRKIWEEAEAENPTYFVSSRTDVPLQSSFKPNVTLLSRKATPTTSGPISLAKKDSTILSSTAGISNLSVQDDEDDEEDEEAGKPKVLTAEERAMQAQKEREVKQRRYDEARERLFGSGSSANASNTAGSTSPLRSNTPVRNGIGERGGRGRGRGGGTGGREMKDVRDGRDSSRPGSSMGGTTRPKQLFEPGHAAKPDSIYLQKREAVEAGTPTAAAVVEEQVIRTPRGPDGNGKGFVQKSTESGT